MGEYEALMGGNQLWDGGQCIIECTEDYDNADRTGMTGISVVKRKCVDSAEVVCHCAAAFRSTAVL